MTKPERLKCLRCGYEYTPVSEKWEKEERVCPKCQSNSVRLLPQSSQKVG